MKEKNYCDEIWVFDLDGTLWKENSHLSIVEMYIGWKKYTNIISRIWGKMSWNSYMDSLNKDYNSIPKSYINKFEPHIKKNVCTLLQTAVSHEKKAIIISNAPEEIVNYASKLFLVDAYHADIWHKDKIIFEKIGSWDKLVVVTDNLTDKNLIELSDKVYFIMNKKKNQVFKELKPYLEKIRFLNEDDYEF